MGTESRCQAPEPSSDRSAASLRGALDPGSSQKPREPLERLRPACLMERVASLGRERPLIDNESGSLELVVERECHDRPPVVGIRLFPFERVHEPARRIDLRVPPAQMECLSLRRLHRDAVPPAVANIEVDARSGEASGTPPLGELIRLDARGEHPLSRRPQDRLQSQGETTRIGRHWTIVSAAQRCRIDDAAIVRAAPEDSGPQTGEDAHVDSELAALLEQAQGDPYAIALVLFGSAASGSTHDGSDLDVWYVLRGEPLPPRERRGRLEIVSTTLELLRAAGP
jgi:hypothetical protein